MTPVTPTVHDLITSITHQLTKFHDAPLAQHYAWYILEAITNLTKAQLLTNNTITLSPTQQAMLHDWLSKHIDQLMPLAYLIGTIPFIDATIKIQPPVLIPRPETEEWVARLIDQLGTTSATNLTILDMCTGSGCIAIALAQALPDAHVYAVDIADHALRLTEDNARANNVTNVAVLQSDLFTALSGKQFDLIVSNPPYISNEEWYDLDPSVKNWEDPHALVSYDNGLGIITTLITQAPSFLKKNSLLRTHNLPQLIIEIGSAQGEAVKKIAAQSAFAGAIIIKDIYNHDRIVALTL